MLASGSSASPAPRRARARGRDGDHERDPTARPSSVRIVGLAPDELAAEVGKVEHPPPIEAPASESHLRIGGPQGGWMTFAHGLHRWSCQPAPRRPTLRQTEFVRALHATAAPATAVAVHRETVPPAGRHTADALLTSQSGRAARLRRHDDTHRFDIALDPPGRQSVGNAHARRLDRPGCGRSSGPATIRATRRARPAPR